MLFLEKGNVICISLKIILLKLNPDTGTYCFNYHLQKNPDIMKVQSKLKGLTGQKEIYYWCKKHIWLDPGPSVRTVWINELCGNDCLPASSPLTFQQPRKSRPGLTFEATPSHRGLFGRLVCLDFRKQTVIQAIYLGFQILDPCAIPEGKVVFRLCCRGI